MEATCQKPVTLALEKKNATDLSAPKPSINNQYVIKASSKQHRRMKNIYFSLLKSKLLVVENVEMRCFLQVMTNRVCADDERMNDKLLSEGVCMSNV